MSVLHDAHTDWIRRLSAERWQQAIEPLLDEALDTPPDERPALLEARCSTDPELRAAVEQLLRACDEAEPLLASPAGDRFGELFLAAPAEGLAPGESVGPYRIIGEAGQGGMGAVYVAERADDQYRKRVALKLVRGPLGRDAHALRRFREERQILASLDHAHVARLLDGGVTSDGLPWFAMEYVEGQPIDRYCDTARLPVDQRLRLFLQVCDAVAYAHRNLVVHRDLKPSNVLVTGAAEVKLLDFGIAKLLAGAADPELTGTGIRLMTPEYASPEQVRGEPVTTASDVYSLGVVLYELLTGRRPYRLAERSAHAVERAVLEQEPERPSVALDPAGASVRATTPERLRRRLRGDLDTIILTALRKEPDRRYAGAEQLAADLRRHLDGQPVSARRGSWRYRAGKFAARHRAGVAAAAGLLLLILGFAVVTSVQSARIRAEAARVARERDKAERISGFLVELLSAPDPWQRPGEPMTVRELLDVAVRRVDSGLAGDPDLRGELLGVMGRSYGALGLEQVALPLLDSAIALRRRAGADDDALAQTLVDAAIVAMEQENFRASEAYAREAIASYRRRQQGQPRAELASALSVFAGAIRPQGRESEQEAALREAAAIDRAVLAAGGETELDGLLGLARYLVWKGDSAGAVPVYREVLDAKRRSLGDTDPMVGYVMVDLAVVLAAIGDTTAGTVARAGFELARRGLGEDHGSIVAQRWRLANVLQRQGELAAAESVFARVAADLRGRPYEQRALGRTLADLGRTAARRGAFDRAERALRESYAILGRNLPSPQARWGIAATALALGEVLTARKKYAEAEPLLVESYTLRRDKWGADDPRTVESLRAVVDLYEKWGRGPEAARWRARLQTAAGDGPRPAGR